MTRLPLRVVPVGVGGSACAAEASRVSRSVSFTVAGIPAPQGSKTRTRYGMREDNPATRPWREAVAWEATAAMTGPLLAGPLELAVEFRFPRPKSHFRANGSVKESAPTYHVSKPDTDKLLRAIGDSLTGIVFRDDSEVAFVRAWKQYGSPHAWIQVREMHSAAHVAGGDCATKDAAGSGNTGGGGV